METTEGFALGDSAAIIDYILEKTPEGPLAPKDAKTKFLAKDVWSFCNDYYSYVIACVEVKILRCVRRNACSMA